MLNWVQPELILTRNLILLANKFRETKMAAMDVLREIFSSTRIVHSSSSSISQRSPKRNIHSQKVSLKTKPLAPRVDQKRALKLYFCLDLVLKRFVKKVFLCIQEYRHQNAVENFEFQIMYFNKFTQTYQYYFRPLHVAVQVEEELDDNQPEYRLRWLCRFVETKKELNAKGSYMAVRSFAHNRDLTALEVQIDQKQRKLHRIQEWAKITELKKVDAETKLFLSFVINFFERTTIKSLMGSFSSLENSHFDRKLKKIAMNNVISLSLRIVGKEFNRFKKACLHQKEKLHFDHASVVNGLYLLREIVKDHVMIDQQYSTSRIKMEGKQNGRMSVINWGRSSNNQDGSASHRARNMTKDERVTDGSEALRYIFRRQMISHLR